MPRNFVLDSYAILAVLEDEPGADFITELITGEGSVAYMSAVNLGEVYYVICRRHGLEVAEEVLNGLMQEDSLVLTEASWPRIKEAARIKAGGGLSYADAFVLQLSFEFSAAVVTGNPEIRTKAEKLGIEVVWIDK